MTRHTAGRVLRLLLVGPGGEIGGAEQVFLALARRMPEFGVEPLLACMRPGPLIAAASAQGLTSFSYRDHRYRHLMSVRAGISWLAALAADQRVDLIHATHTAHLYSGPAARRVGRPEIWHLHDYPYTTDWVEWLTLTIRTDYTIFTTDKVRSGYPKLQRGPHSVIYPNIVDPEKWSGPHGPGDDLRRRYRLDAGSIVMNVARLQPHKGHADLLRAVPAILKLCPDTIVAIVGKAGSAQQEVYRQELIRLSDELGVADHVRFLGFVPDDDLAALYREATVLAHPSRSEGYGLTLLEAMAAGLPVVATEADGPAAILRHEQTGLLVPIGRPDALASALLRVLGDPAFRRRLSDAAGAYVRSVNCRTTVERTVNVYRQLLGGA